MRFFRAPIVIYEGASNILVFSTQNIWYVESFLLLYSAFVYSPSK